jgi:hypothetical protein
MTNDAPQKEAMDLIRRNIERHGHHIYVVAQTANPRFAYTIGASESLGVELMMAGAIFYMKDEVVQVVNNIISKLKSRPAFETSPLAIGPLGSFTLRKVDSSWAKMLMLGAMDYYNIEKISALQIVPDKDHWTSDVPDMREPWSATSAPAWQWLGNPWTLPAPSKSVAATNLAALRGELITEAARWEEDEWEICAGPATEVSKEEMRVVPLGTLLAADESLAAAVSLPVGKGIWRDEVSGWHPWGDPG